MYNDKDYETFVKKLEETYPKMFGQPYGGIAVGSGWWLIIEKLCESIQSHINWKNQQFEKYGHGTEIPQVVVEQIKEKFGGLRFYYQGGDEYVNGMVRLAEAWADATCEVCGEPGKRRSGGWIRTLCDTHEEERQAIIRERQSNE
jgi:hypothetical protein